MTKDIKAYLHSQFGIDKRVIDFCEEILEQEELFKGIDDLAFQNQMKVLQAMSCSKLSSGHFAETVGYGYDDIGRQATERIFARTFSAEDALARPQIISGTHALTVALFGNLRPGDELLAPFGAPYETLLGVIGIRRQRGSLYEHGVAYRQVMPLESGGPDFEGIRAAVTERTKLAAIQRSRGYSRRRSLTVTEIGHVIAAIKEIRKDIICMVDNCYGEFTETIEPSDVGADLTVGSLIKNPGGGLAPVGGYIAGRAEYVENAAYRLTAPGLGKEAGPTLGTTRPVLQGLFLAPQAVSAALKGAVFASAVFDRLGFAVSPGPADHRPDIVQAIDLNSPEVLAEFCAGIQSASPVDGYVLPEPAPMPGYGCEVIMAAGGFVQGSSIELSADAPMRPPYTVYLQGGLTWHHARFGVMNALDRLFKKGYVSIQR
ncbi:MAG: methionine gamma-lyase family protein [Clostridiales bacterium]|nr:methionine gamma-lyase family protein [Clostridiales bacterium]